LSADGKVAVSVSEDGILKVWDVENGRGRLTIPGHDRPDRVAVSADGKVAIAASHRSLSAWDVENGREWDRFVGYGSMFQVVAVSAKGESVVSASQDGTLRVWAVESGKEKRTLSGHAHRVNDISVKHGSKFGR